MLILLAYMLLCPASVMVNRGNHEDTAITRVYGFLKECEVRGRREMDGKRWEKRRMGSDGWEAMDGKRWWVVGCYCIKGFV